MEATASDPERAAAVRHDGRHARRRAAQRAGHAEHPRRALGHLQGRLRPPSRSTGRSRPAHPRCARCSGSQPDALERAAELDATYGREPDLEAMPMYGVVFSFKDPFDTKDMRSTGGADARLRHRLPGAGPCAGRAAPRQGRDHLRQGGQHRVQRPDRATRAAGTPRRRCCRPRSGYQRSTWAGNPANAYDTTRSASLGSSSGSGVSVSANLVMVQPRRGDAGVVPRAGQPQRGRARPPAQGDARVRRRRHRRRHPRRPQRDPRPHPGGRRQGPRRPEGPGRGLLRPARPVHDGAAVVGPARRTRSRARVRRAAAPSAACASASSGSRC